MKTDGRGANVDSASPKVAEFWLTFLASVLGAAFWLNIAGFSDEKASYGYDSMAYGGGETGTPNLL